MTDPFKFLTKVWSYQPDIEYGFLSVKDWEAGTWQDFPVTLPLEKDDVGDAPDTYFAPVLFKDSRRLKQNACGGVWLFADLDEVDPRSLGYLPPQVAWETSPGRFQALWRMADPLGPKAWERLNRSITYRTGADRGGWSLTKVLRVPGTVSTKHGFDFTVAVVMEDWDGVTDPDVVRRVCSKALPASDPATGRIRLPKASAREIRRTHWAELSPRARKLIRSRAVRTGDDRSAKLWELENLCLDAGMTPGETVKVVQDTVWNKFKGQRREMRMLMQDVVNAEAMQRAKGQVPERRGGSGSVPEVPAEGGEGRGLVGEGRVLEVVPYRKFMAKEFSPPGWLVEHIWSRDAFGWWVGQDKAYKTTTVLDLAVSIASGERFLGRFAVKTPGRVLYLHNEGKPAEIQGMLHRIAFEKGAFGPEGDEWGRDLPLDIRSLSGFNLAEESHREELLNYIRTAEPVAVILETWYLLAGDVDENEAKEVKPVIQWLLAVAEEERCAMIVSHHFRKGAREGGRISDAVSGSGVFARAFESRFTIERVGEEEDHLALFQASHRYEKGSKHTISVEYDKSRDEGFQVRFLTAEEEMRARGETLEADFGNGNGDGKKVVSSPRRKSNGQVPDDVYDDLFEGVVTRLAVEAKPFVVAKEYPTQLYTRADHFRKALEELNCGWQFRTLEIAGKQRVVGFPPGVEPPE